MTNFEKITENKEIFIDTILPFVTSNCGKECPGYCYCDDELTCLDAIKKWLDEETFTIEELKLGDRFKVTNSNNNNTYMRTTEIVSASGVEINAVNLDTGYYTWFKKDLKVKRVD